MSDAAIVALAVIAVASVVVIIVRPKRSQRLTKDVPDAPVFLRQPLSAREREVASLAAQGYTNKQIAARLNLSVTTVRNHLTSTYGKIGVSSRADLAKLPYLAHESQVTPDREG